MTSHLDDGTIHELLDGEIPSQALPPIQSHLAACSECRMRLDAARELVAETDDLIEALDVAAAPSRPMVIRPPRLAARPWIRRLAWAASVAIAVGAGYYGRGDSVLPRREANVVTAPGVAEADGASQPAPAVAEQAAAKKPAVTLPVAVQAPGDNRQLATDARRETVTRIEPSARLAAEALPKAAAPPVAVATGVATAAPSTGAANSIGGVGAVRERAARSDLVARDQVATKQLVEVARADTISFLGAVRLMGGTLRLIEGMVPSRLESIGSSVRVIYPVAQGELVLSQSVVAGVTTIRLTGPAGFPADSLARLRERIKP